MESNPLNKAPKQASPEKGLSPEGLQVLRDAVPVLQARMALIDRKDQEGTSESDNENYDRNDPQRQEALMNWATGGMAAKFRDYVEDPLHATETINPDNPEELRALLQKLRSESDTMH
ncbi:MAG: hypothetical protein ABIT47_02130 [Candidatus Paceibacterota bacterium]